MTQVFFYHGASDKIAAACALLSGAYAKKKPMLVFASDSEIANNIDRMLWTHSALSFIPHCRADSPLASNTPIQITNSLDQPFQTERLMNLSLQMPPDFARFESLIEVVGQDDSDRSAARDRVRQYKEQGCDVRYFDLSER